MRKGRSQRKARSSLLPLSQAPRSAQPSADGASARGSGPGPQVVIGLSDPPSSEHAELLDPRARAEGAGSSSRGIPVTTQIGVPKLQPSGDPIPPVPQMPKLVLSEPSLELVREAERLELVREKSLEIVRESLELVRESLAESAALAAFPEEARENDDERDDDASSSCGADFTLTESQPPVACAESAESVESLAPHTTSLLTPEEQSIPPVVGIIAQSGDLAVEPIAERFFSEGELVAHQALEEEEWDQQQDKGIRKSHPHVVERRAHLAKYVRWAVGGAALVCLAALGTSLIPRRTASTASTAPAAAAFEAPPPAPKAADVAVVAEVKRAPVAAEVAPAPLAQAPEPASLAQAPEPTPLAQTPEPVKADGPAKEVRVATGDKTASEEKKDARRALERGKTADAIAAGERSVALDPTDGEAWLLLGAAYQEKGKNAEARRCFVSCLKEGKRGPLGECRAMVR